MPLRTRLSDTGLKLKIPARTSPGLSSPYGPSPRRQTPSPHRQRREERPGEELVQTFDASVDGRAVWSVTSHKTKTKSHGFREIQIHQTQDLSDCDSLLTSASNNNRQSSVTAQTLHDPLVPRTELHSVAAAKERQLHRAEILRDWIQNLPTESNTNPFFSPTPPLTQKKELNYQPYKYLSSPLPNYNQSPYSSDK